jgi:hypothetical protein
MKQGRGAQVMVHGGGVVQSLASQRLGHEKLVQEWAREVRDLTWPRGRGLVEAAAHVGAWLAEVLDGGRMKRRWREAMDRSEGRLVVAWSLGSWWLN